MGRKLIDLRNRVVSSTYNSSVPKGYVSKSSKGETVSGDEDFGERRTVVKSRIDKITQILKGHEGVVLSKERRQAIQSIVSGQED